MFSNQKPKAKQKLSWRNFAEWVPKAEVAPDAIRALAEARLAARRAKDWAEADRLRGSIKDAGWEMDDRADGYTLRRR